MSQDTLRIALKAIFDEQKTKTDQQASIDEMADDMATAITDEISDIGFLNDRGNWDASGNVFPSTGGSGNAGAIQKGDIWTISVEGVLGGKNVYIGNTIRALIDNPLQVVGNWAIGTATSDHAGLDNLDYENSGHIGFQEELVSGTNIKTINSTTLLGSGNFTLAQTIIQSLNNSVATGDWTDDTGTSGFWYADISNANITSNSIVNVIPEKAYKSIVDTAVFASETDSSSGSVRIYAENQPSGTIEFTLNIHN